MKHAARNLNGCAHRSREHTQLPLTRSEALKRVISVSGEGSFPGLDHTRRTPIAPEFEHIMGQAHQTPFPTNLLQTPEQEAAKTPRFFDLTKHGFHNDLAPGVQRTARRRAHFRGHPLLRCGGWGARLGLWGLMP